MLIKHKKGGVLVGQEKILFPKGEAVEIADEKLAKQILRNSDFEVVRDVKKKKEVKE